MTRIFVATAIAAAAATAAFPSSASGQPPSDVTLEGPAGGGTIQITFTPDLSGVLRIALRDVDFPPAPVNGCGTTVTSVKHYDPPESVMVGPPDCSSLQRHARRRVLGALSSSRRSLRQHLT